MCNFSLFVPLCRGGDGNGGFGFFQGFRRSFGGLGPFWGSLPPPPTLVGPKYFHSPEKFQRTSTLGVQRYLIIRRTLNNFKDFDLNTCHKKVLRITHHFLCICLLWRQHFMKHTHWVWWIYQKFYMGTVLGGSVFRATIYFLRWPHKPKPIKL